VKTRKPIIGITTDFSSGVQAVFGAREPTYFLRARYALAIEDTGGIPLFLPITQDSTLLQRLLNHIDGLLLTGSGPDLDPSLYGDSKRYKFKIMSKERAAFELAISKMAVEQEVPVLGLCGGMQVLNVALGGTLVQDISSEIQGALRHRQQDAAVNPSHEINIVRGTRLSTIIEAPRIRVNSSHHQAVQSLGRGLIVNAVAPDGVIEGLELNQGGYVLGVQWHPEFLYRQDSSHRGIFDSFLRTAAKS
jgi:putative glutamine amidotransferase